MKGDSINYDLILLFFTEHFVSFEQMSINIFCYEFVVTKTLAQEFLSH